MFYSGFVRLMILCCQFIELAWKGDFICVMIFVSIDDDNYRDLL